jgi:hypothetical protein
MKKHWTYWIARYFAAAVIVAVLVMCAAIHVLEHRELEHQHQHRLLANATQPSMNPAQVVAKQLNLTEPSWGLAK